MALELEALKEVESGGEYYSMLLKWQSRFLHIADATASAIRDRFANEGRSSESPTKKMKTESQAPVIVGLVGTEPTMRERYLKDRLLMHRDAIKDVVAPQKDADLAQIFR